MRKKQLEEKKNAAKILFKKGFFQKCFFRLATVAVAVLLGFLHDQLCVKRFGFSLHSKAPQMQLKFCQKNHMSQFSLLFNSFHPWIAILNSTGWWSGHSLCVKRSGLSLHSKAPQIWLKFCRKLQITIFPLFHSFHPWQLLKESFWCPEEEPSQKIWCEKCSGQSLAELESVMWTQQKTDATFPPHACVHGSSQKLLVTTAQRGTVKTNHDAMQQTMDGFCVTFQKHSVDRLHCTFASGFVDFNEIFHSNDKNKPTCLAASLLWDWFDGQWLLLIATSENLSCVVMVSNFTRTLTSKTLNNPMKALLDHHATHSFCVSVNF